MTRNTTATRRRALAVAGALLAGAAGCTGDTGGGGAGDDATDDGMGQQDGDVNETEAQNRTGVRGDVPTEQSDGATVAMESEEGQQYFEPEITWITPGTTVTFVDESGVHTATAYASANDRPQRIPEDAEAWDTGYLNEGEEFEQAFETTGVYDYYCIPHEAQAMLGTVIVGEPDPGGQPGLAEPQDEFDQPVADKLSSLNQAVEAVLGGGGA